MARDQPHRPHERAKTMRGLLRPSVVEELDPLRVGSRLPNRLNKAFPQHLGQILGRDARGEALSQHHPVRAVDHARQAPLPAVPRSDARDVRGPAPVRFGHAHLAFVPPPGPSPSMPTGRQPAPLAHGVPHHLGIARQSLALEQGMDRR
jgi:hypothetical protein